MTAEERATLERFASPEAVERAVALYVVRDLVTEALGKPYKLIGEEFIVEMSDDFGNQIDVAIRYKKCCPNCGGTLTRKQR